MFHAGGGDMDDMMSQFFGGGMGGGMGGMGGGGMRRRKGKDIGVAYPVTLEDLYLGKTDSIPRQRTVLCPACKGSGSNKKGVSAVCASCRGQGAKIVRRMIGPGMVQQMQVPCDECRGEGRTMSEADKCKTCRASRTTEVSAPLKLNIEKGMGHEDRIPFPGQGDQNPDIEISGDIIVVLQQADHKVFTRDGDNLFIKQDITLAEALCGFTIGIEHLDKRTLVVKSEPGTMIQPGDKKCITGEGMPIRGKRTKGDLIIEFNVVFPERLEEGSIEQLKTVLPPPTSTPADYDPNEAEEAHLSRQPLKDIRAELKRIAAEDDDDEGAGGGGGVRCAQQ